MTVCKITEPLSMKAILFNSLSILLINQREILVLVLENHYHLCNPC